MIDALGMIEVIGWVPAVAAADGALKAANVHLLRLYKVGANIVTIALSGDVSAVQAATEAGSRAAEALGPVRATHVIARLQPQVVSLLLPEVAKSPPKPSIKLRMNHFMAAIPAPNPIEVVDSEGVPLAAELAAEAELPILAAAIRPAEMPQTPAEKPANKRSRRKKTAADEEAPQA